MKRYQFLIKPIFFIFSVFFAAWLTLKIEKLSPSNFGSYKSLFEKQPQIIKLSGHCRTSLKKLFFKYKSGLIDSVGLDQELEKFSDSSADTASFIKKNKLPIIEKGSN
jgi:hypothetical protein